MFLTPCSPTTCDFHNQIDQVKNDFVLPWHMPNWTNQSYFLDVNFIQTFLKKYDSVMVKKQNCLPCQDLEAS